MKIKNYKYMKPVDLDLFISNELNNGDWVEDGQWITDANNVINAFSRLISILVNKGILNLYEIQTILAENEIEFISELDE